MSNKKIISLLMIFIIASTPFTFAQPTPQPLFKVVHLGGNDNIKGYMKPGDNFVVEALVTIPGQSVVKEQVHLEYEGEFQFFQECTKTEGDAYKCIFESPTALPGEYTVSAYLYKDRLSETAPALYTEKNRLQIDSLPPAITLFELNKVFTRDGKVKINYKAEDYWPKTKDTTSCSGIKQVEFKIGNEVVQTRQGSLGRCTLSEVFEYNHITTEEFEAVKLCVSAFDFFDRPSKIVCKEFSIDSHAPIIESAEVTDKKGFHLTHLRPGEKERDADLIVKVIPDTINEKSDLEESLLFADLSSANPSEKQRNFDEKINDETFLWNVRIKDPVKCNAIVKAQDKLGNKAEQSFPCKLPVDDVGPELVKTSAPSATEQGVLVFGINAPIKAVFKDLDREGNAGIGMHEDTTRLNLGSLGLGIVKADLCEKTSDKEWTCTWKVKPTVNSGKYFISLDASSITDALGNKLKESIKQEVVFDRDPPKIFSIEQKIIAGEAEFENVIVAQNQVRYIVNTTSDVVSGLANFTQLGGDEAKGDCSLVEDEDKVQCIFDSIVQKTGPYNFSVNIAVFDAAGNTALTSAKGKVYELVDEAKNYWKTSMACTPKLIDRSLASLIPHTVYCHIKLKPLDQSDKNIKPLSVVLSNWPANCKGDIGGNIADIQVIHEAESQDAYLQVFLQQQEVELNKLEIACDVSVFTMLDNKAVRTPEVESVNSSVGFYNLPHGELYGSIENEIKKAVKDSENMKNILEPMSKLLDTAENVCKTKTAITGAITALYLLVKSLGIVEDILVFNDWIPGVAAVHVAVYEARVTACGAKEAVSLTYEGGIFGWLDKFCLISNCQLQSGKGPWGIENIVGGQAPWCRALESSAGQVKLFGQETLKEIDQLKGTGAYSPEALENIAESKEAFGKAQEQTTEPIRLLNVKDSIIWSVGCLCLPGIVNNLEKYRQIKCRYAQCLIEDVKKYGISPTECRDENHYLSCAYWTGEIWETMPFSRIFDSYAKFIGELLTDPGALISAIIGNFCYYSCPSPESVTYTVCASFRTLSTMGEAIQSFVQISKMKSFTKSGKDEQDYCSQL
ncbi:hypothetical protein HYV79_04795 [Candidatus Woesearchaeota archaeon]|nr:hypothetical protein [Candidatus Woesearchaeota archaeon]